MSRDWLTPEVVAKLGTMPDKDLGAEIGRSKQTIASVRKELGIEPWRNHSAAFQAWPEWVTPDVLRSLGTESDAKLGKRVGMSASAVGHQRRKLERNSPEWLTAEVWSQFGLTSDRAIADTLGLSTATIREWRAKLGVPPSMPKESIPADEWLTDAVRERMGVVPDAVVAAEAGVPKDAVYAWRNRLGIAPYRRGQWVTDEIRQMMGKVPDHVIAEKVGVTADAVCRRREALGIESDIFGQWLTDEVVSLMGTMSDQALASRIGVSKPSVQQQRVRLGIPSYRSHSGGPSWLTDEIMDVLGKREDREIAALCGVHPSTVSQRRRRLDIPAFNRTGAGYGLPDWLTEDIRARLGTVPDGELAPEAGVKRRAIGEVRRFLGIAAYEGTSRGPGKPAAVASDGCPDWLTPDLRDRLGTVPDRVIAEAAGVTGGSVSRWRRKLRIPAARKHHGRQEPGTQTDWLTDEVRARLGFVPDRMIAEEVGRTVQAVAQIRNALGIEPATGGQGGRPWWMSAEIEARLGTVPDGVLAKEAGVSTVTLMRHRNRLGIQAFKPH